MKIKTSIAISPFILCAFLNGMGTWIFNNRSHGELKWSTIKTENFDCDFRREGRFHGAHTPIEFKKMVSESNDLKENEGIETQIIPKSDQKNEINSDLYHGGVVFPQHASLNAAKYHKELIEKAFELGVHVISSCEMVDFKKRLDEFSVLTNKGPLKTKNLR